MTHYDEIVWGNAIRNRFYLIAIILCLFFNFPSHSDSIKVGETLYEGIYLQPLRGGYNILFSDGKTLSLTSDQYDPTSIKFSPPLERVKLEAEFNNSPLQKRMTEEKKALEAREKARKAEDLQMKKQEEERKKQEAIKREEEERLAAQAKQQADELARQQKELARQKEELARQQEEYASTHPLEILDWDWKKGEFGIRTIQGTIRNNTSKKYSYLQITINLYDSSDNQVGNTLANICDLEPHGTWQFEAIVLEDSAVSAKITDLSGF